MPAQPNKGKPTQLYDLEGDIGEKNNVIKLYPNVMQRLLEHLRAFTQDGTDQHPKIVADLKQQAEVIRAELGDVHTTGTDQREINLVDPQER